MNKRMMWMLIGTGIVFGGVFGMKWFGGKMMNQYFDNMPMPPAVVSSATAKSETWAASLSGVGTVVASNGADVTTESGGIIAALHFESGARVKKGDLLVTLSAGTERADLARLQAQADLAKSEYARLERLFKLDAISKSELDRAQADLSAARAGADAQRAKLAQKQIRAPFSGQLGIRQVNVGQYLSAGTPIVSLQAINPVFVDFTLPEQNQAAVEKGQTVTVVVDSQPGRTFSGVISAIEPMMDSKTRNFKVRARFDNADEALRPGLFARASIGLAKTASVVTIPQTSVSYNPYGNSVYVIQSVKGKAADGKVTDELVVRRRFIKTGETRGDLVVVTDGLKAGEQVATSGLLKLQNDSKVKINNTVQPSASATPTPTDS
ncbi:efflux RND transporter periplasmic adaptor subunit [Perlucidibaca aquatica]|uniref:efflux RND transporter periplasmic adaptor subunit n=1 Tax=Perlucidibaca aquatica TaxID=1852776 RepID=UPI00083A196D|nr:efflux RND transporter periplasmic adaptor subunit [Perlucidibaca aquatica]